MTDPHTPGLAHRVRVALDAIAEWWEQSRIPLAPPSTAPHYVHFHTVILEGILGGIGHIMSTQDLINADVAAISAALQSYADSQAKIAADISAVSSQLAATGVPAADLTALDAIAATATSGALALADTATQLDAVAKPAPAAPVEPVPAPVVEPVPVDTTPPATA